MKNQNEIQPYETAFSYWPKEARKIWTINLFVLSAILYAARVAMPVCATAISKEYGWNKADLGAVMGSFFWGYVTTQVLGGYFADKIGGDKVIFIAAVAWAMMTLMTPSIAHFYTMFGSSIFILTAVRVGLGVTQGVHYPSIMSLVSHKVPQTERSFPMGVILSAGNFGSLLCGSVGSIVLEHYSWQRVFQVLGLTALLWTYFMWIINNKQKNISPILLESKLHFRPESSSSHGIFPWRIIFSKAAVWSVVFAHLCNSNSYFVMVSWFPTFFHEHFPDEKGWVYNVVPWIMSIPSSIFSGWLCEHMIKSKIGMTFIRKFNQCIAMGGSATFLIVLPHCKTFWSAVLCAGLAVSFQAFHHTGALVNPQDITPGHSGSVFGVMNAFGAVTSFIGVYLTGYTLNATGTWVHIFSICAIVNLLGATVFIIWGTTKKLI